MTIVETHAGPIEVEEYGDPDGRLLVFVGGLAMSATVWRKVVRQLPEFRCVTMTLPLGAHKRPMRADADLSLTGLARLEADVLDALDARDAVLIGNDSGAYLAAAQMRADRLAGLVVTTCEAFDHFPPGLPGRLAAAAARAPGALTVVARSMQIPFVRASPTALGWMARRTVPRDITDAWVAPLAENADVLRDLRRYLLSATKAEIVAATEGLADFTKPALVVWTPEDRVMDPRHGRRIADVLPQSTYREVTDSYTLIPEDQPDELASAIREFVGSLPARPGP